MKRKLLVSIASLILASLIFWGWLYFHYSVPILMYHSFDKNLSARCPAVSLSTFCKQMEFIEKSRLKVVLLDDYCRLLRENKKVPHNLVVITIDDGLRDNLEAIKILKKLNWPATIFLIVGKINQEGYLSEDDVNWFLNNTNVRIGSHTLDHIYLPQADDKTLKEQIKKSKDILKDKLGVEIGTISYPIGGFDERVIKETKNSGYLCGCTTNRGLSGSRINIFALRRIKITERDLGLRLWAKLGGFYNIFKRAKSPY